MSGFGKRDTSDPIVDFVLFDAAVGLIEESSATLCITLPTVSTDITWPRLKKRLIGLKILRLTDSISLGRVRGSTVSKNAGLKMETFSKPVS